MRTNGLSLWFLGVLLATMADAAVTTNRWLASDGKWEDGDNWGAGVPSADDALNIIANSFVANSGVAIIDTNTVFAHVINNCLTISNLIVGGSTSLNPYSLLLTNANDTPGNIGLTVIGALTITPFGTVTITNSRMKVLVDLKVDGSLQLNSGLLTNRNTFVGVTSAGRMTMSGGTWQSRFVDVAGGPAGTLTIAGGTATILETFGIGFSSTGTVWLTGGELVCTNISGTLTNSSQIGRTGAHGQMIVSNGTWRAAIVEVGSPGRGTLTIAGGTSLFNSKAYIGSLGTGAVWITGGQLTATNSTTAVSGLGQVTISNGLWRARHVVIGVDDLVRGPAVDVGGGTITVAGGTSVISSNLTLGVSCTGTGFVHVAGGSLFVTNAAHNAVLDVIGGTLTLSSGSLTVDHLLLNTVCSRFIRTGGALSITSTNLPPFFDADGDGLPNYWELENGLDVFDQLTGVEDPDGDGLDNYVEYLAGTDPHDPTDPFRITAIAKEGNDIRITWDFLTPPGNPYDHCIVEANPTVTGTWTDVSGPIALPLGFFEIANTNFVESGGATNNPARFYRVRLVP
jgi:Bacterial TSP3 repeat